MKPTAMIVAALAALACISGQAAQAETNSLMAVSMRTFPADHFARRATPRGELRGRTSRTPRPSGRAVAVAVKPAVDKVVLTSPPQAPVAAPKKSLQNPPKPAVKASPSVSANLSVEAQPAAPSTKVAALNGAATTRTKSLAAPQISLAPVSAAITCKRFVPAAGLMVDVPCEK